MGAHLRDADPPENGADLDDLSDSQSGEGALSSDSRATRPAIEDIEAEAPPPSPAPARPATLSGSSSAHWPTSPRRASTLSGESRAVRPATQRSASVRPRRNTERPMPIVGPDSVPRAVFEVQLGWLAGPERGEVREALGQGELEKALGLLEAEQKESPDDDDVARGIETVSRALEEQVVGRLGGYDAVPRRVKPIEPGPDRRDGLTVLSEVDGSTSIDDILRRTMIPRLRAARLLESMRRQGTLHIAVGRPRARDEDAARRETPTSVVPLMDALRIMAAHDSKPPPPVTTNQGSQRPNFEPDAHDPESLRVLDASLETARPPAMYVDGEARFDDATRRETSEPERSSAPSSVRMEGRTPVPPSLRSTPTPGAATPRPSSVVTARNRRVPREEEEVEEAADSERGLSPPRRSRRSPWSPAVMLSLAAAMAITAASVAVVITSRLGAPPAGQTPPTIVVQAPQPAVAAPPAAAAPTRAPAAAPPSDDITVKVEATPKSTKLWLDDIPVPEGGEQTIQRDGRVHVIRAEAVGYKTRRVTFEAAGDVTLVIALERFLERGPEAAGPRPGGGAPPPPKAEPAPAAPPPPEDNPL